VDYPVEVWSHNGVEWRLWEGPVLAAPEHWVVTIGQVGQFDYRWTVDYRGAHAEATVGSVNLARDQLRWAMRQLAFAADVEPPSFE
jgi:hypothetical protein